MALTTAAPVAASWRGHELEAVHGETGLAQLASVAQQVATVAEVAAMRGVASGWLPGGSGLDELELARPQVRSGNPLVELGDRLARVHRFALVMTTMPRPAVGDLVSRV